MHAGAAGAVPDTLMRDADIAMYEAKRAGCGDYAIFDSSMHENAVSRLALQTDLRQAVCKSYDYMFLFLERCIQMEHSEKLSVTRGHMAMAQS